MKKKSNAVLICSIVASIVLLVSINYFASSDGIRKPINWELFKIYAMEGDVQKLELLDGRSAQVYIKKDRLRKNKHKTAVITKSGGPNYTFQVEARGSFKEKLSILNNELAVEDKINLIEIESQGGIVSFLKWLIPICFIVGLPIFLTYRYAK